jgi:hypothetical protein
MKVEPPTGCWACPDFRFGDNVSTFGAFAKKSHVSLFFLAIGSDAPRCSERNYNPFRIEHLHMSTMRAASVLILKWCSTL